MGVGNVRATVTEKNWSFLQKRIGDEKFFEAVVKVCEMNPLVDALDSAVRDLMDFAKVKRDREAAQQAKNQKEKVEVKGAQAASKKRKRTTKGP
eukprot:2695812-Pyramimonas_sp.AAC.1